MITIDNIQEVNATGVDPIVLPITATSGNLLLAFVCHYVGSGSAINTPAGWTKLTQSTSTDAKAVVFGKVSDGTEGATVSITVGSGTAVAVAAKSYSISDWSGDINDIDVSTPAEQSASASISDVDPTAITASWGADANNLFFTAGYGARGNKPFTVSPTGYTSVTGYSGNDGSGYSAHISTGYKIANAATDDPSIYTAGTYQNMVALGLVVKGAAAADTTPPVFTVVPAAANITQTGCDITATIDEDGTIYAVRLVDGAAAPSSVQVKAGQDSTGSAAPEAKSVAATAATQASMTFSTGSASTPYDYYVVAEDDEGSPNLQASPTLVEATTATPAFTIDSLSAGPYYAGDTVTINVSNASASGKTLSIPAGALTVDSQDATTMTFTVPDPKTFGTKVSPYSSDITITADDGGNTDTIAFQISPTVGHAHATITATTGIYADDVGIAIGDRAYGYWVTGTGSEDLTVGAIQSDAGGTFRYWIQDDTDSTWGNYADEVVEVGPDVTAPVLSSPTGTQTAYDTADGTVSTDEGNGTLYYYASQNASETASTIKASGSSQAVVSSGVQNVSYTGLTESTTYYAHYVQDDSSSNESNVVVSASFTTPAAPDVAAPVLTLGTGIATGNTTADGSVTTNEGNGTLYYYASVNAVETAATIKASGGSQAVGVSGVQSVGFTDLATDTTYYAHYVQDDSSANESNVVSSAGFDMPDTVPPVLSLPTGVASGAYSATGSVTTDDSEGAIYYLATTNAVETAATVKASPRNRVVSATGVYNITYTGLTPETTYYLHYIHIDGGDNESNVASSASFTTGVASAIPPSSRESVNKIADYLRSTEAHTQQQTNTVVTEWLLGEGISKSQLNQMLYTYLLGLGYTGSINDMLNKWSRDG